MDTSLGFVHEMLDFVCNDLVHFIIEFGRILFVPIPELYLTYLPSELQFTWFESLLEIFANYSLIQFISVGTVICILLAKLVYQFIPG